MAQIVVCVLNIHLIFLYDRKVYVKVSTVAAIYIGVVHN